MFKKKLIVLIIISIILIIFVPAIIKRMNFAGSNIPKDKVELVFKDNSVNITKSFEFKNLGCYEVGLYSKTRTFSGFLMESPDFDGEYTLTYSYNNNTIQIKNATIKQDSKRTGFTRVGTTSKHSTLMLDLVKVPLKQYKSFTINLQMNNLDKRVTDDNIYFFIRPTNLYCGKQKELRDAKDIKTPENNKTLKPLYDALQNENITKLKNFFKETKLPYNVTMQGNRTALHYAIYFDNANATAYLLSKDKSILEHRDITNKTALSYAIEYERIEAVKELLKYKPDFENVVIGDAHMLGSAGILKFLYKRVEENKDPYTGIMRGIDTYDEDVILDILLEAGLNPNVLIIFGGTIENPYMTTILTSSLHSQDSYLSNQRSIDKGIIKGLNTRRNYTNFIEILKKHGAKIKRELQGELSSSNDNTTINPQGK